MCVNLVVCVWYFLFYQPYIDEFYIPRVRVFRFWCYPHPPDSVTPPFIAFRLAAFCIECFEVLVRRYLLRVYLSAASLTSAQPIAGPDSI